MKEHELTHARHDRAHCLVPGLFRSIMRGERKKTHLEIAYEFGNQDKVLFLGFEPLGADDMRVLQGLVAMGGPTGITLDSEPESQEGKQLRSLLELESDATSQNALVVRSSLYGLLAEIGLTDTGKNTKSVRASLRRLSNVTVIATREEREASFHLLSYAFDHATKQFMVALNPRLTSAILGENSHVHIDMDEVRSLVGDPARLIHQRLCGWIDPGKAGKVTLDTLCKYVWPDAVNDVAMKKRRQRARKHLSELIDLNWRVFEYAKEKFEIQRPRWKTKK